MNIYTRQSDTYASGQYVTSCDSAPRSAAADRKTVVKIARDKSARVWRVDYRGPLYDSTIRLDRMEELSGRARFVTILPMMALIAYLSDFDFRYVGKEIAGVYIW